MERGNDLLLLSEVGDDSKTAEAYRLVCPAQAQGNGNNKSIEDVHQLQSVPDYCLQVQRARSE